MSKLIYWQLFKISYVNTGHLVTMLSAFIPNTGAIFCVLLSLLALALAARTSEALFVEQSGSCILGAIVGEGWRVQWLLSPVSGSLCTSTHLLLGDSSTSAAAMSILS